MNKEAFHRELYGNEQLYKIDRSILKNALVILHHNSDDLSDDNKSLLDKILGAIGKSLDAATLINTSQSDVEIDKFLGCTILFFGVPKEALTKFPSTLYRFEEINGNRVLASDSLSQLEGDTGLKTSLWNSLKLLKNQSL